jgi:acyl-CoA thioesterase FadM
MGLIHTPRTIAAIARGLWKPEMKGVGFHPSIPHIYESRVGVLDADYMGHMNNASTLTHAELARWEMTATSGALNTMYRTNTHFMVASSAVRYRREVRPIFRKFQIETVVGGIDDRNIWM